MLSFQLTSAEHIVHSDYGPLVILFGRGDTSAGAVCVKGVAPFLWMRLPPVVELRRDGNASELRRDVAMSIVRQLVKAAEDRCPPHVARNHNTVTKNKVTTVTLVRLNEVVFERKKNFYGYEPEATWHARLPCTDPWAVALMRNMLLNPFEKERTPWLSASDVANWFGVPVADAERAIRSNKFADCGADFRPAEANVGYADQALAVMGITPGAWFQVDGVGHWKSRTPITTVKLELYAEASQLSPLDRIQMAPLRVLSFDIETYTRDLGFGHTAFFKGHEDGAKLISIACTMWTYGTGAEKTTVLALGDDNEAACPGIRWFATEVGLLKAFAAFITAKDPDVVTGYNVFDYDWEWLFARARALGISNSPRRRSKKAEAFGTFGRLRDSYYSVKFDDTPYRGRAPKVPLRIPGRIAHDVMAWIKKNRNLRQYNLDYVSKFYNCGAKEDIKYNQIGTLWDSGHDGRVRLASYAAQDAVLPLLLARNKKLDIFGNIFAIAAICCVLPHDLAAKGTQHTLKCKLLRLSADVGFVLPTIAYADDAEDPAEDEAFKGGKVLVPKSGRYLDPIAVMDFASLYPSCMMELNTCKSTQISRARAEELNLIEGLNIPQAPDLSGVWITPDGEQCITEVDEVVTVNGRAFKYTSELNDAIASDHGGRAVLEEHGYALRWADGSVWRRRPVDILCFVSSKVFLGVIPLLERTLKEDRKAAKVRRDTYAEDSAEYAYLDKLQNAIKVLMNSAYGGFGTRRGGVFPDGFKIAAAITAAGRNWICTVKRIVESRFWLFNGILGGLDESEERPSEAQALRCIYGDTDSVFVHFPGITVATAAEYSTGISRFFGQKVLPYPHDLEFEKIYYPFVSWKAKMYTGRKYEGKDGAYQEGAKSYVHSRGISTVRRDNALIVRNTVSACLDLLLDTSMSAGALARWVAEQVLRVQATALVAHTSPELLDEFVVSAGIGKDPESYDGPPNAAAFAAAQILEDNPSVKIGASARVTLVVTRTHNTGRAQQAMLPERVARTGALLDVDYYVNALRKKLDPLISVFFVQQERDSRTERNVFGHNVVVQAKKVSEQKLLPGRAAAARSVDAVLRTISPPIVLRETILAPVIATTKRKRETKGAGRVKDTKVRELSINAWAKILKRN